MPASWSRDLLTVAEKGAGVPLLNLSMKCSRNLGWHSRSANVISRRGPEQLTDVTTGKITNPLAGHAGTVSLSGQSGHEMD